MLKQYTKFEYVCPHINHSLPDQLSADTGDCWARFNELPPNTEWKVFLVTVVLSAVFCGAIWFMEQKSLAQNSYIGETACSEMSEEISSTIEAAVGQQGEATNEIARSIQQAALSARSPAEPVQRMFDETENTSKLSQNVERVLVRLNDEIGVMKDSIATVVRSFAGGTG